MAIIYTAFHSTPFVKHTEKHGICAFCCRLQQERAAGLKQTDLILTFKQFKHLPEMSLDMRTEPHGVLPQQIWLRLSYTVKQVV